MKNKPTPELVHHLLRLAVIKSGENITPVKSAHGVWDKCINWYPSQNGSENVYLYYNDSKNSTHVVHVNMRPYKGLEESL